ncbi:MAG: ATP-binding protein [Candidatus Omnitrophota bacterium]
MNKLLERQIRKFFGSVSSAPEETRKFFEAIGEAYDGFERDRVLMERAFDLSSREISDMNEKWRVEIEKHMKTSKALKDSEAKLKKHAMKLEGLLEKAARSRKRVVSMLDDNNRIREELIKRLDELKKTQKMLVQSEKLSSLGRLVSEMAHEVNNPLQIISGRAQLAAMEDIDNPEIKETLELIMRQAFRAKSILDRLLKFSKPDSADIVFEEKDIHTVLNSVIGLIEHQYLLRNVVIIRNFASGIPPVTVNENQIEEVFLNLLKNSDEAMPSGGTITVSTACLDEKNVRIDLTDTGTGILAENMENVFDPFFTTKKEGTGLGLSVCYGIIKQHKGTLSFESVPGHGTTVTMLLPAVKQ